MIEIIIYALIGILLCIVFEILGKCKTLNLFDKCIAYYIVIVTWPIIIIGWLIHYVSGK